MLQKYKDYSPSEMTQVEYICNKLKKEKSEVIEESLGLSYIKLLESLERLIMVVTDVNSFTIPNTVVTEEYSSSKEELRNNLLRVTLDRMLMSAIHHLVTYSLQINNKVNHLIFVLKMENETRRDQELSFNVDTLFYYHEEIIPMAIDALNLYQDMVKDKIAISSFSMNLIRQLIYLLINLNYSYQYMTYGNTELSNALSSMVKGNVFYPGKIEELLIDSSIEYKITLMEDIEGVMYNFYNIKDALELLMVQYSLRSRDKIYIAV